MIVMELPQVRKLPRQERSRALVDAIVEAAGRILVRQGREAVTTNAVAVIAGVSIGSLYQYFPHREAIIAAVAHRHAQRLHRRLADLDLTHAVTLEHAVTRIVAALFEAHALDPALHVALDHDLSHGHAVHTHGEAHAGTKPAIVALLRGLAPDVRREIVVADFDLSAIVVAELLHCLAHAAIREPEASCGRWQLQQEAARVTLAYLKTRT